MGLTGKVAVIAGATSEIGRAVALRLSAEGASVAVAGRTKEKVDRLKEELYRAGAKCHASVLDLSRPTEVDRFFADLKQVMGPADILVNMAAWRVPQTTLETTFSDWKRTFEACVDSYFLCSVAAARHMIPHKQGRIILFGSVAGSVMMAPFAGYTAAKGAVHAMAKAMAVDLAPFGITVNVVAPGPVETKYFRTHVTAEGIQKRIERMPMGRFATPEDCASVVAHLVAEDMGYVTGQIVYVDGGFLSVGSLAR